MSKSFRKDLTGQRFGRLTVVSFYPNNKKRSYWDCKCDCGSDKTVRNDALISGRTISCGCEKEKQDRINLTKHHSHLQSGTRIYSTWQKMKNRCYNRKANSYNRYGGRGITVCDEWRNDFQAFYKWAMSNGYTDDLTIDRIDVNGNYEPSNCRWVDIYTQNRNRRSNIIMQHNGIDMCLSDIADLVGINAKTVLKRYENGDRGDRLFRPVGEQRLNTKHIVEYNGERIPLSRASKLSGIPKTTLFRRYHKGLRGVQLFKK